MEIKFQPPSWQMFGDLAIDELKQGHTQYAIGVIPLMVEKLVALEGYANEDGKLSVNSPKSIGEANREFKENYPKGLDN